MGLAAMAFVALVALVVFIFIFYGIVLGLTRLARVPGKVYRWTRTAALPTRAEQSAGDDVSCWEEKNCSMPVRNSCPAYENPLDPCWLTNLRVSGKIKSECVGCSRFSVTEYVEDESIGAKQRPNSAS